MPQNPPTDWTSGYGVYGFNQPTDAEYQRLLAKAQHIGPSPTWDNQTLFLDKRVDPALAKRSIIAGAGQALQGMDFGGIIPADSIRTAVEMSKAARPRQFEAIGSELNKTLPANIVDKIKTNYQGAIDRLYQTHPRVMATIGDLGLIDRHGRGGTFVPSGGSANELLAANRTIKPNVNDVGNLKLGRQELLNAALQENTSGIPLSVKDNTFHEATHGAQRSIGSISENYDKWLQKVGYDLNPYEIGARATSGRQKLKDTVAEQGRLDYKLPRSYIDHWAYEANKALRSGSQHPEQVKAFEQYGLPEWSKKFGLDKTGERLIIKDGKVVREIYKPGVNEFNTWK
jgi:hypothetical protein